MATTGLILMLAGAVSPAGIVDAPAAPREAIAADATPPHPKAGLWRLTDTIGATAVDGAKVAASPKTSRTDGSNFCYRDDDVENFEETLQQNADDVCDQLSVTARDGQLFIAGSCDLKSVRVEMAGRGAYDATAYSFDATGTGKTDGHLVDFTVSFTGRYLRPCTAVESKE